MESLLAQCANTILRFLLSIMNQYSIRPGVPSVEAEKLLRIALFSHTLKLAPVEEERDTLKTRRNNLAYRLRAGRRQGLVPIFLSSVWWMFGLSKFRKRLTFPLD